MSLTIGEMLTSTACQLPEKTALICDGRQITYQELNARVNQLTHGLLGSGMNKTTRVAIFLNNSIELVEILFALAKAGMVGIPLNLRLTVSELSYILEHSHATALIWGETFESTLNPLRNRLSNLKHVISVKDGDQKGGAFGRLCRNQPTHEPDIHVEAEDASFIIYTSGTTGKPKGVVLTHNNHVWNSINYTIAYSMKASDVELALTPMFHSSTLGRVFTYVFTGATFITSKRFDPREARKLIDAHKVTSITQTPTMYAALIHLDDKTHCHTQTVKRVVTGAAPLPPALKDAIAQHFPRAGVFDLYGLTEASPGVSILKPSDPLEKMASVGRSMMSVRVKIVGEDGRELPFGEVGEIVCRGPNVMKGYYNDWASTQEVLREGWLYTGDLGMMDSDGYLYLTGRKKELIVSGGANIYPAEIEGVLQGHPLVLEAAVIGIPDAYWGERVKAVVVTKPGSAMDEQAVIDYCKSRLASYKKPTSVDFMDALPKNTAGKVMKKELLKRYRSP